LMFDMGIFGHAIARVLRRILWYPAIQRKFYRS